MAAPPGIRERPSHVRAIKTIRMGGGLGEFASGCGRRVILTAAYLQWLYYYGVLRGRVNLTRIVCRLHLAPARHDGCLHGCAYRYSIYYGYDRLTKKARRNVRQDGRLVRNVSCVLVQELAILTMDDCPYYDCTDYDCTY